MECVFINEYWTTLLMEYGSIVLFVLLALGIIILPIPDETLLVFAGALMAKGILIVPFTVFAAATGSVLGISISYFLGRSGGTWLIQKYGGAIGITTEKMQKAHDWFEKYGKWTLTFGYFLPGVRHFTGLTAGVSNLQYPQFALFAYSGAILWVTIFLSLGYYFGNICFEFLEKLGFTTVLVIGVAMLIVVTYLMFKNLKKSK